MNIIDEDKFGLFRNNKKNFRIMTYDKCQGQIIFFLNAIKKSTP